MKWSSILVLGTLAFLVNACEKHPAAQLPPEHATAFGEHAWPPKAGSTHGELKERAMPRLPPPLLRPPTPRRKRPPVRRPSSSRRRNNRLADL